ncbi:glutamate racemase [Verrucomicrobiales bacterium]|nr:glutamate racemase [Verrucomicrobiales bacterium]
MQQHSIGILDSGLGGLSVLREIRALLPNENLHYIADSAWCPYGPRSFEEIIQRTSFLSDHLIHHGAKAIVIACNSATIAAIGSLRATYPLPFVGMEPAVKPAAAHTKTGTIGVLATEASLAGEKFHRLVSSHASGVRVITRPCPEFVELVEAGILDGPKAQTAVKFHIDSLLAEGADVLVLGCSHYPFLRPLIERAAGENIEVIDTGSPVSKRLKRILETENLISAENADSKVIIQTTGDLAHLKNLLPTLCPGLDAEVSAFE